MSLKKLLFTIFVIINLTLVYSQSISDSLSLSFNSKTEEKLFYGDINDTIKGFHYLESLLAIDSTYNEEKIEQSVLDVDTFIKSIEKKASSSNEKKRVKYIYEKTHDEFFRKYELGAVFSDIFKNGNYNCVSATALYAYIFDYFQIPYEIKETPVHVYIVAYPKSYNMYIETTLPGQYGSYMPSEKTVARAVDELVELKYIEQSYVSEVGYPKAYNEYFYGEGNIKIDDLVGIQYYNKAIEAFNNENYIKAYLNIQKSSIYYKNKKIDFLKKGMLGLIVDTVNFDNIENFYWFKEFINESEGMNETEFIKHKFYDIISSPSLKEEDLKTIKETIESVKKEEIGNSLLEVYYVFLAKNELKYQKEKTALKYAKEVYKINPDNLEIQNIISFSTVRILSSRNLNEERLIEINETVKEYPFIDEFGLFNSFKAFVYAYLIRKEYIADNPSVGKAYLNNLEKILDKYGNEVEFHQEAIGEAYGSVGAYYFRRQKYTTALTYLNKGLVYSPKNAQILRKIKFVKSKM